MNRPEWVFTGHVPANGIDSLGFSIRPFNSQQHDIILVAGPLFHFATRAISWGLILGRVGF